MWKIDKMHKSAGWYFNANIREKKGWGVPSSNSKTKTNMFSRGWGQGLGEFLAVETIGIIKIVNKF